MSSSPSQDGNLFILNIITSIFDHHHHQQEQPPHTLAILTFFPNFPQVKEGPLPASKSSIESLQTVKVTQEEECAICMMEYGETGELAKEMPCKHKFHADCVNKWLGIRGTCPVCRFEMPVDEEEKGERDEGGFPWQLTFFTSRARVSGSGLENGLASEDMDSHQESNQDGIDDN